MAAVLSMSALFPVEPTEDQLRASSALLTASGSFPVLAALFDEAVEAAVTEIAVRLTLSQSIDMAPLEMTLVQDENIENNPETVVATAPAATSTAAPVAAAEEAEDFYIYDGLDEEDDWWEEEDDFDVEYVERKILKSHKLERLDRGRAHLPIRATNSLWEVKQRNKRVRHTLIAKMDTKRSNKIANRASSKGNPNLRYWEEGERRRSPTPNPQTQEERDLAEALRRSRREGHIPAQLSVQVLLDLQNRELTPEDYELLLLLDETVEKKKISKDTFKSYESKTLEVALAEDCPVCMSPMAVGEQVTTLPCGHQYHTPCIEQWLTGSSPNCPLDGLSLLPDN